MSHYSCNSSAGTDKLFAKMFPDSLIAKQFKCGATKCSYLICFGIAPYFHGELMKLLQEQGTMYVISFDELKNRWILLFASGMFRKIKLYPDTLIPGFLVTQELQIYFIVSSWLCKSLTLRILCRYPWMDLMLTGNFLKTC